jgi:hypothetical protein
MPAQSRAPTIINLRPRFGILCDPYTANVAPRSKIYFSRTILGHMSHTLAEPIAALKTKRMQLNESFFALQAARLGVAVGGESEQQQVKSCLPFRLPLATESLTR